MGTFRVKSRVKVRRRVAIHTEAGVRHVLEEGKLGTIVELYVVDDVPMAEVQFDNEPVTLQNIPCDILGNI